MAVAAGIELVINQLQLQILVELLVATTTITTITRQNIEELLQVSFIFFLKAA
jgi:hypothetical protein